MRLSGGKPALRSMRPYCTSIAQRTASTTLAELDEASVARALHHAAMVQRDCGVDEVAAKGSEPRQRAVFVCFSESAVADNI